MLETDRETTGARRYAINLKDVTLHIVHDGQSMKLTMVEMFFDKSIGQRPKFVLFENVFVLSYSSNKKK
jgi:hypothetical protein